MHLPQPPPRIPRETMRGYAIRPDADSTMQIGSFGGAPTPFPSATSGTAPGGIAAQTAQAAYPGPLATPAASPTPFPQPSRASQQPPPSGAPSSDNEPTTFYKRDAAGAAIVPGSTPSVAPPPEPSVEPPPDTARKLSSPPQHPSAAAQPVSRHTARIISDPPPAHRPISSNPPPQSAQARPESRPAGAPLASWSDEFKPEGDVEWQKLWLATQRRVWRSLAIIPAGKEVQTLRVAEALAVLAWHHLGKTIKVFDATRLALSDLESRLSDMSSRVARGESVIVAFGPILESPASLTLARATDAALLCIILGESQIKAAEASVSEIGEARFIGSVIVDETGNLP